MFKADTEKESRGAQWKQAFPQAKSYGPPGFQSKFPQLKPIELRDKAPDEWLGEIDPAYLAYERNPFTGKPFFHEVPQSGCLLVLLHRTPFWSLHRASGMLCSERLGQLYLEKRTWTVNMMMMMMIIAVMTL